MVLIIEEYNGFSVNELYQACETYLSTRISPLVSELKISKEPRRKAISVTINKGQKLVEDFQGVKLSWEFVAYVPTTESSECRSMRLSFHRRYKERVLDTYIPSVVKEFNLIIEEEKPVRLFSTCGFEDAYSSGPWSSVILDHPSTFDTMAMDPGMKKDLIKDLDQFVNRREFYKRIGKAWKRGYLLYGPSGTGKSSLVAAIANYLKFDFYDMELTSLSSNSDLKRLLVSTANRSILVIEDIDCSIDLENRVDPGSGEIDNKLTLSGLLNFIDGLWSSCGNERIIVFTTNYKEKIDPALLRPGRMDKHIYMGYCCTNGFRVLAKNYLGITGDHHHLFTEIDKLLRKVEVTSAEIAEELLKKHSESDGALRGLIDFLKRKGKDLEKPEVVDTEMKDNGDAKIACKRTVKGRMGEFLKAQWLRHKAKS